MTFSPCKIGPKYSSKVTSLSALLLRSNHTCPCYFSWLVCRFLATPIKQFFIIASHLFSGFFISTHLGKKTLEVLQKYPKGKKQNQTKWLNSWYLRFKCQEFVSLVMKGESPFICHVRRISARLNFYFWSGFSDRDSYFCPRVKSNGKDTYWK